MNADTAHDLRTVGARVSRDGATWNIVSTDRHARVLATIRGNRGAYVATVQLPDGGTAETPTYKRHDDAVDAAIAPWIGAERGERWAFPAPNANDWMHAP
jgi:hypothetical protein